MAPFGRFTTEILMAVMIVSMFCVTNIVAQDSEIAPTGQLEAGAGFALPVSEVIMCSSVLASLVAFMLHDPNVTLHKLMNWLTLVNTAAQSYPFFQLLNIEKKE
ncbi:unnamed protein product [Sphenostylis stenocarpa]|uniref:Uncharacterized protein n=1 Tax=Sphenostylis stenocarpa TaxID=92480 RepID=A0AA86SN80_9FABA|nr:unnamed protein product [Sphenostylis stenocarpa]